MCPSVRKAEAATVDRVLLASERSSEFKPLEMMRLHVEKHNGTKGGIKVGPVNGSFVSRTR